MNAKRTPIPFTGTPFPKAEYESRQQRVLDAVERAGLDAILVTTQSHLRYLTGYSGLGAYFRPFPFILAPGRAPTFIVRAFDEGTVRAESCIDEIIPYTEQFDFPRVCADVLRRYGLHDKRVGMQLRSWGLAPADVSDIEAELPDMTIVDATPLVPLVAAVKSEAEIEALWQSAAITDLAIASFHRSLREGVTEAEVADAIRSDVAAAGGELSGTISLSFGERLRLGHGKPEAYPLKINDAVFIELSGASKDYAAALCRSAVLGRHPGLETLHSIAEEALEAGIEACKPGATAGAVNAAVRAVMERHGRLHALRSRTGYQIGVYWSDRGNISLEPKAQDVIEVGMTFHMPIILFDEDGHQIGCSESWIVTERGSAIFSKTPHTIHRV